MTVYPCGYSAHASQIAALMDGDPSILFIDLRRKPDSQMPAWRRAALVEAYGTRYGWFGETLGNANYRTGGPVHLINPQPGIAHLVELLHQGYRLLLVCGCRDYEQCHRRQVVELLHQAIPELQVIHPEQVSHPGTRRCLSIRQPWSWLITHPEVLATYGLPVKDLENRDWTTSYRGELYIHAGAAVEASLFDPRTGSLDAWYWKRKWGHDAGHALHAAMPQHKDDYPRKALVGLAQLTDVVTVSQNPWFNGPYGLVLSQIQAISPISCLGSLKIFEVPATLIVGSKTPQ